MVRLLNVATCQLNQFALDFVGNLERIKESIKIAKEAGAKLRVGPELEVTGYGCLDHFLENDVIEQSEEVLLELMSDRSLDGIVIDLGMPVSHRSLRLNCRVLLLNGKLILIRPKIFLANDGNYRLGAAQDVHMEEYKLPPQIAAIQGARTVPIGDCIIDFNDTSLGVETCEELFTPMAPHIEMALSGAEVFSNASGSHHSLRKFDQRLSLILEATSKNQGVYIYANQQGCDGDRLYYDGTSMIIANDKVLAQATQFSLNDVEVCTAVVDLDQYPRLAVEFDLTNLSDVSSRNLIPTIPIKPRIHCPEEEIALGPAAWLWDYLCSTATLCYSMACMVVEAIKDGNDIVKADVRRIAGAYGQPADWLPSTPKELCQNMIHTVYSKLNFPFALCPPTDIKRIVGMREQSSQETRDRAAKLSEDIGSYHVSLDIDDVYYAEKGLLTQATGYEPKFKVHGGTHADNLALQNIQARTRMVTAYLFAQELPAVRKRKGGGGLLVLASGNVDECLRGYLTKYDCSSADLCPIGSISKVDLKKFLHWGITAFDLPVLESFLDAVPTAELEPRTDTYIQSDEVDMGFTYVELSKLGRLRKEDKLGPLGMFERLVHEWRDDYSPREIAKKVKDFHHFYALNRHKQTTMTPAYHAEAYSVDDNRFDLRPFLYPPQHSSLAFRKIDKRVEQIEKTRQEETEEVGKNIPKLDGESL